MTLTELSEAIRKVLKDTREVDWLILRRLKAMGGYGGDKRITFEGKESPYEPFRYRQGRITVERDEVLAMKELLRTETEQYSKEMVALSNLFIIQSLTGGGNGTGEEISAYFEGLLSAEKRKELYLFLMQSLKDTFFIHAARDHQEPMTARDWTNFFTFSMAHADTHEVLIMVTDLISSDIEVGVPFEYVRPMKPVIRGILIGFWAMNILMDEAELQAIVIDPVELPFIGAYVVNRDRSRFGAPQWVNAALVEAFLSDWQRSGSYVVTEVLGEINRQRNHEAVKSALEELVVADVSKRLSKVDDSSKAWINQFVFPADFLGIAGGMSRGKIPTTITPSANDRVLLDRFFSEMKRITDNVVDFIHDDTGLRGPRSWLLHDAKFQYLLAYLLIILLETGDKKDLQKLKSLCYSVALFYYGGSESEAYAMRLSKTILLMVLSADRIQDPPVTFLQRLGDLLDTVILTILPPFVHTIEREEEIWNPECEGPLGLLPMDHLLINNALDRVQKSELAANYTKLFDAIKEIAVAIWPYMDGREVPIRVTNAGGRVKISTSE